MCLRSSRRIANGHQVARLGGVRGIWRWKATENRAGTAKSHALRTPIADSRRLFAEATSRRCSRSAIPTVGPQVYCQWANLTQVPGSSNRRGRLWEFHSYGAFSKTGLNVMNQLYHRPHHTAVRIYRSRAQHTGSRGSDQCRAYKQGQRAAHRAQGLHHILVYEYSRVYNCYPKIILSYHLGFNSEVVVVAS